MKRITDGQFYVFTFKEGLLSSIAHDLRLSLPQFEISFNGADVDATFNLKSLVVDGAMSNQQLDVTALSAGDLTKIKKTIDREVLKTSQFSTARLSARLSAEGLVGTLHLHGRSHAIAGKLETTNGIAFGAVEIAPSNWGIKPYQALFGALKLQDRVLIEFEVELPV